MTAGTVAMLARWLLRIFVSLGVLGAVRKFRAFFDYLDFVSACQLNMDAGTVGNVQSAIVLEGCVPFAAIVERFRSIYLGPAGAPVIQRYRRLCSVAHTSSWRWPYWSTPTRVPALDEDYHFVDHGVGTFADIEAFVTDSLSEGLDLGRPLWQLHYWSSVSAPDGKQRSVFVLKVHHCVADGFSTLRAVLTACERRDGGKISDGNARSAPPAASTSAASAKSTDHTKERAAALAKAKPVSLPAAVAKMLLLPQDPVGALKSATHLTADSPRIGVANWPGVKPGDTAAARGQAVSVDWLKEIGRATPMQATVNDLLLAALAGALRRHVISEQFAQTGGGSDATAAQAVMWVSLAPFRDLFKPHTELPLTWGNGALGAVYLALPLDVADPGARLQETCDRVRQLTRSPEPVLGNFLIGLFGALPRFFSRPICKRTSSLTALR
jgi:diacylglycerol O-acyltransferase